MLELEVKSKVRDSKSLLDKLEELNIKLSDAIEQHDLVYFRKGVVFETKSPGEPALRVRTQNGKSLFTLKYSRSTELDKVEYETEIGDPGVFKECLSIMDYYLFSEVKKLRRKATYQNYEICIDEVDNLGTFIEVELQSESADYNEVEKEIWNFLNKLGLDEKDKVTSGYDVLIYKKNKGESV